MKKIALVYWAVTKCQTFDTVSKNPSNSFSNFHCSEWWNWRWTSWTIFQDTNKSSKCRIWTYMSLTTKPTSFPVHQVGSRNCTKLWKWSHIFFLKIGWVWHLILSKENSSEECINLGLIIDILSKYNNCITELIRNMTKVMSTSKWNKIKYWFGNFGLFMN